MPGRPPWPYRWETQVAFGVLSLLVAAARRRSSTSRELGAPGAERWREADRRERAAVPWRRQFELERSVLGGVTSLLLAWRAHHHEQVARRR